MPTANLAPGVYVKEVSTGPKPIMAVGTSTAAFVGKAPRAAAGKAPMLITNWAQFRTAFCDDNSRSTPLSHAVYGFFRNGGSRCYVADIGDAKTLSGSAKNPAGLALLEPIDEVAIVAAPGFSDAAAYREVLDHCEALGDRFAILDPPEGVEDLTALTRSAGPVKKAAGGAEAEGAGAGVRPPSSTYGAFYFPRVCVTDPFEPSPEPVTVAASGHLAGLYARTDFERGVHKAPANDVLRGVVDLEFRVTRAAQGDLNANGVNVIRSFTDGLRVWGARTLADPSSEYRYINVRRLMNMVKESIQEGTRWVVFEPNDETLWKSITRDVSAFLMGLWREGALRGSSPEEAFIVKCDAETNPPDVIDRGEVITEIGIAPVKPAEFILFKIGQSVGGEGEATKEAESAEGQSS